MPGCCLSPSKETTTTMLNINQQQYLATVDQLLQQYYAISFQDTGYDEQEWLARFGDQPVAEAVLAYAKKYDLTKLPASSI